MQRPREEDPLTIVASKGRKTRETFAELPLARGLDVGIALAAVIVLSPLFLISAILILIADGRPVFFRQTRVGRNGELFGILKFRTMEIENGGPAITAASDRRVTLVGAKLRKYKLDELPQFFCVLRGHMSLIGPRPEVPEYVDPSDPLWEAVLQMRPGITDLASLAFRNEEDMLALAEDPEILYRNSILREKLRLNLAYQRSRSLKRDLKLLWMTALYSFYPKGFDRDRVMEALSA
ncbi:MAG TPA: sugar transferase [Terriglobales bacterium]|nr:sugar transferase [Terriglobales bacterium]